MEQQRISYGQCTNQALLELRCGGRVRLTEVRGGGGGGGGGQQRVGAQVAHQLVRDVLH